MLRRGLSPFLLLVTALTLFATERPASPDQIYGQLFVAVQRAHVFDDQKTFVDCVPRIPPSEILKQYRDEKGRAGFDLKAFVERTFLIPELPKVIVPQGEPIDQHIEGLWDRLRREQDTVIAGSSLLPLPEPYIVPGGRFREIYYWDSYFTMLGLRESGREDLIASMIDNFAYLIRRYGVIPNGNRSYFLTRSQPPFFSLMLDLLAEKAGEQVYVKYLPTLKAEHDYWMDRTAPTHHAVKLPGGERLSRYYDLRSTPRPEAFAKEEEVAARSKETKDTLFRNLRAAAESGWDFSSRWFADGKTLETIVTTDRVPVDLNCLLQHLEITLAKASRLAGDEAASRNYSALAEARRAALLRVCWSPKAGYFCDFDLRAGQPADALTLAGVAPLFFHLATAEQAAAVAKVIEQKFLQHGGVATTLVDTGQQWDWPNGWAPLQWMTIRGLENYGFDTLAGTIAQRWLALNREVYARTGKMMEKYNVVEQGLVAGGGEYPTQDGFGWTNGVYLALSRRERPVESTDGAKP